MTRIRRPTGGFGIVSPNLVQTHVDDVHVPRLRAIARCAVVGATRRIARRSQIDHDARRTITSLADCTDAASTHRAPLCALFCVDRDRALGRPRARPGSSRQPCAPMKPDAERRSALTRVRRDAA